MPRKRVGFGRTPMNEEALRNRMCNFCGKAVIDTWEKGSVSQALCGLSVSEQPSVPLIPPPEHTHPSWFSPRSYLWNIGKKPNRQSSPSLTISASNVRERVTKLLPQNLQVTAVLAAFPAAGKTDVNCQSLCTFCSHEFQISLKESYVEI